MRWGLLWWNVITVVSSSFTAVSHQDQTMEEPLEPVEPVDTIQQIDDFELPQTTQSSKIPFYEPGTDFFAIPELYRHIKAGKNTTGLYVGPTFSKEFMIKTPSEKRVNTGFKLLDWKRRRKRLDAVPQNINSIPMVQLENESDLVERGVTARAKKIKTEPPSTEKVSTIIVKFLTNEENRFVLHSTTTNNTRMDDKSLSTESTLNPERRLVSGIDNVDKIYTQSFCENPQYRLKSFRDSYPSKRPWLSYSDNDTFRRKRCKKRANSTRKRSKRAQDLLFKNFVELKRVARDDATTRSSRTAPRKATTVHTLSSVSTPKATAKPTRASNQSKDISTSTLLNTMTDLPSSESHIQNTGSRTTQYLIQNTESLTAQYLIQNTESPTTQSLIQNTESPTTQSLVRETEFAITSSSPELSSKDYVTTENPLQSTETSLDSKTETNETSLSHETLHKKESPKFVEGPEDIKNSNGTSEETVTSKAKAKIIIGGEEIPLRPLTKEQKISLLTAEHANLLTSNRESVFAACVTPPPSTTWDPSDDTETQRADCHPKGSGPLYPATLDPEAYGPKNEEEIEDALTGKLADRIVEVISAKVEKCPRMMKELGLYAQGNLSNIQSCLTHPESKEACKEKSSEALKISVLEDITNAVERLANSKSSGLCLKPPEDLTEFLAWLLSEDADLDMPEPSAHLGVQPRREADYLFRSSPMSDEFPNEYRDTDLKYNWEKWMTYGDDSSDENDNEAEGKGDQHARLTKNLKRSPRHLLRRNRNIKRSRDRPKRRRRYTPWSLCDYP